MSSNPNCILCGEVLRVYEHLQGTERYSAECNKCGKFWSASFNDTSLGAMTDDDRAMLSAFKRELYEHESPVPNLDTLDNEEHIVNIVARYNQKSINEKLDNLVWFLAKQTKYFGDEVDLDLNTDQPITFSKNRFELENIYNLGKELGRYSSHSMIGSVLPTKVTGDGWAKFEEFKKAGPMSQKCFVAMSCNPELSEIFENGIKRAVEEAGYQPIFIEREEHNEKICDLIVAEIRSSRFLVADITGQRPNVYYEAGFAHGLDKEVIWTCRASEIDDAHFDTRQYNHIVWDNPDDLKTKLLNRIRATII